MSPQNQHTVLLGSFRHAIRDLAPALMAPAIASLQQIQATPAGAKSAGMLARSQDVFKSVNTKSDQMSFLVHSASLNSTRDALWAANTFDPPITLLFAMCSRLPDERAVTRPTCRSDSWPRTWEYGSPDME